MKPEEAEKLKNIVKKLGEKYRLHAVILFGSRARGDWGPWSDYDLLVIADFQQPYLQRIADVLETVGDTDLPMEIHPYTPQEAAEMLEKANPTIVDALEEGKPLYASPILQKLKNKLKQLKQKGLQKTHTTVKIPT